MQHDGRVVKALDLSSNGRMSAWVRTPLVLYFYTSSFNDLFNSVYLRASIGNLTSPKVERVSYAQMDIKNLYTKERKNVVEGTAC